jgi:signal transduction histidine kinase
MTSHLMLRITAPIIAICFLLLALGVVAAWQVDAWQKMVAGELRANVSGIRAGEELEILVREARTGLDSYLISANPKSLDEVRELRDKTEQWLAEAERWTKAPEKRHLMERARNGNNRFWNELDRIRKSGEPNSMPDQVRALIDTTLVPEVLNPAHEYLDLSEEEVEASIARHQMFADRLVYALLLLGVCGSACGLFAGFGLARGLSRRLIQLSVLIRDAAGRLDVGVEPINISPGQLGQMENVLRQIAERVTAIVAELQQRESKMRQAEQLAAVGQLAASMAHELRNPLTSMKILVQTAMTGSHDGKFSGTERAGLRDRDLVILEDEINRLDLLIQSFLDLARPPKLEKQTMDIRLLAQQTCQFVVRRAAPSVSVNCRVPLAPAYAAVDPGQLRQVLLNLLLNSLDAVAGRGQVSVTVEDPADEWIKLHVSDTGCGLPSNLAGRLFEPFATTKETGLGLGLSICKRIMEAHGGSITGGNRPGGGAVFTLRLPTARTNSQEQTPPSTLAGDGRTALPSGAI